MPKRCNTQDKLTPPRFLLARLYLNLLLDEKNEKRVRILGAQLQSGSGAYDSVYDETARPLMAVELQNAIAVEIGEPLFDETNITDIEEMILVCYGLVAVEANSNTAKLVHFTTQEYLKRTFKSWFPNVHSFLMDTCLTYLSFDNNTRLMGYGTISTRALEMTPFSLHLLEMISRFLGLCEKYLVCQEPDAVSPDSILPH